MKLLFNLLLLIALNFVGFSQTDKNENYNFTFYDTCLGEVIHPEYEIESFPGYYYKTLTAYVKRGHLIAHFITSIETENDSIIIPKILFAFDSKNQLEAQEWKSMNCDEVCDGVEVDFHLNGNKSIEGIFKDGKPIEVKNYNEKGRLITHAFYRNLSLNLSRVNFYDDDDENLIQYQIYNNNNKVIETYEANGDLVTKEKI